MSERRTTRCCSAVALTVAFVAVAAAKTASSKPDTGPLALVPVRSVWTLALNAHLTRPPAYDEAHGYFAIEGDRLAAYDVRAGTRRWLVDAKLASAPAAGGGFVFFVQGDQLTALDGRDGAVAWTTPVAEPVLVAPVFANGWLFVAESDGHLSAYRASDGSRVWRDEVGSPAHAPPSVEGNRVYVPAENGRVVAVDLETGHPVWERRLGGVPNEILALADRVFVGSSDNYFYAINASDGAVAWRWRAGADAFGVAAADDRRVYFVAMDNVLRALNRRNGVQQWIQMLKLRPLGGPVKAGATIVVYGLQPPLKTFNVKDGAALADIPATNPIAAVPYVLDLGDLPAILVVTRDIANGDVVTLFARTLEPAVSALAALPNPVATIAPLPQAP